MGTKLAIMKGQTVKQAFVPLPGGATAEYMSWGLGYYRHADWLGSERLESGGTPNTVKQDTAYGPFGEPYAELSGGNGEISFTGQNKDTDWLNYDFMYREYDPRQGRWISPDPAGTAVVNFGDPQSFNRYAYVENSPLNAVDALGLACYPFELKEFGRCPVFQDPSGSNWNEFDVLAIIFGLNQSGLNQTSDVKASIDGAKVSETTTNYVGYNYVGDMSLLDLLIGGSGGDSSANSAPTPQVPSPEQKFQKETEDCNKQALAAAGTMVPSRSDIEQTAIGMIVSYSLPGGTALKIFRGLGIAQLSKAITKSDIYTLTMGGCMAGAGDGAVAPFGVPIS